MSLLETVERFEEDLTDQATLHGPIRAVVETGDALVVSPVREKGAEGDPLMTAIRRSLETLMAGLNTEKPA